MLGRERSAPSRRTSSWPRSDWSGFSAGVAGTRAAKTTKTTAATPVATSGPPRQPTRTATNEAATGPTRPPALAPISWIPSARPVSSNCFERKALPGVKYSPAAAPTMTAARANSGKEGAAASPRHARPAVPTDRRTVRRSPIRSAMRPAGNWKRARAPHRPVRARPTSLFETENARMTSGTSGLATRRATIEAKSAAVVIPSSSHSRRRFTVQDYETDTRSY